PAAHAANANMRAGRLCSVEVPTGTRVLRFKARSEPNHFRRSHPAQGWSHSRLDRPSAGSNIRYGSNVCVSDLTTRVPLTTSCGGELAALRRARCSAITRDRVCFHFRTLIESCFAGAHYFTNRKCKAKRFSHTQIAPC